MPNWVVHLGLTFVLFKVIPIRLKDFRLVLIGSVLPDVAALAYVFVLDVLRLPTMYQEFVVWYFQPWHTPFMAFFYSWALALLFGGNKIKNFLLIYSATLVHFLLDATQIHVGYWQLLGYPFSFANLNFNLFYVSSPIYLVLTFLSFGLLVWAFVIQNEKIQFEFKFAPISFILLVFVFLFPFATKGEFYKNNYHYLQFFSNQSSFEGKPIEVSVAKVVNLNPLQCLELGKKLTLEYKGDSSIKVGDDISFKGIYHKGIIKITFLKHHTGYRNKVIMSLLGLVFLFFFIFKSFFIGGYHVVRKLSKKFISM